MPTSPAGPKAGSPSQPTAAPAAGRRQRGAQEIVAAVAVAVAGFLAPSSESGYFFRTASAMLALAALFALSVALELYQEAQAKQAMRAKNKFEIVTTRVELPASLPGGVFGAARSMSELLNGFRVTTSTEMKVIELGFQLTSETDAGTRRLRARILSGDAVGWEQGGVAWEAQRELWMEAVRAAPRVAEVGSIGWKGIPSLPPDPPAPDAQTAAGCAEGSLEIGSVIRIDGVVSKPELNSKYATVVKAANEAGRYGVRLEGTKEAISMHARNLVPLPALDTLGVSVAALRSFRAAHGHLSSGLTVGQARHALLAPLTASSRLSLARALHRLGASDEAGRPLAAPATVMLVVADGEALDDALMAAEKHAASREAPGEEYVWLAALSVNAHAPPLEDLPLAWWVGPFRRAVQGIGQAAVVFQPWEAPRALAYGWCVWQLHTVLAANVPLAVLNSDAEAARLQDALLTRMDDVVTAWDRKADGGWRKAEAGCTAADLKNKIHKGIDAEEGGAAEFAARLITAIHRWLLGEARVALDKIPTAERSTSRLLDHVASLLQEHGDLTAAEPLLREQCEGRAAKLGPRHADTLEAVNNLALLLHQLRKLDEAEPFSKQKLDGCRATLGDRHPDTVTAIDTHSQLLCDLGKLEEALPLRRESLSVKRQSLGDRHPDTLLSVNNLAVLLNDLGRSTGNSLMLREAEPLKREALAGCREVLGNRHPHTLASIANLAEMLMQLAHIDPRALSEAEPLCREALAGSREVLGDGHPDTLKAAGNLAALLVDLSRYARDEPTGLKLLKEADPLYSETITGFTKGLGSTHPSTLAYLSEHARLMLDLGRPADAEAAQKDGLSACRAALGDGHPHTLICMTHLAGLLRAQEKFAETEPLAKELVAGWRAIETDGGVPRNTLTCLNILTEVLHSQGKHAEAEPLCREAMAGFLAALGPKHPYTLAAIDMLAAVLHGVGKEDEAAALAVQYCLDEEMAGKGKGGGRGNGRGEGRGRGARAGRPKKKGRG